MFFGIVFMSLVSCSINDWSAPGLHPANLLSPLGPFARLPVTRLLSCLTVASRLIVASCFSLSPHCFHHTAVTAALCVLATHDLCFSPDATESSKENEGKVEGKPQKNETNCFIYFDKATGLEEAAWRGSRWLQPKLIPLGHAFPTPSWQHADDGRR